MWRGPPILQLPLHFLQAIHQHLHFHLVVLHLLPDLRFLLLLDSEVHQHFFDFVRHVVQLNLIDRFAKHLLMLCIL